MRKARLATMAGIIGLVALAAAPAAQARGGYHSCGNVYSFDVEAKNIGCSKAKKVADKAIINNSKVPGWTCKTLSQNERKCTRNKGKGAIKITETGGGDPPVGEGRQASAFGRTEGCGTIRASNEGGPVKVKVKKVSCNKGKELAKYLLNVSAGPNDTLGYRCEQVQADVVKITCKKSGGRVVKITVLPARRLARQAGGTAARSHRELAG